MYKFRTIDTVNYGSVVITDYSYSGTVDIELFSNDSNACTIKSSSQMFIEGNNDSLIDIASNNRFKDVNGMRAYLMITDKLPFDYLGCGNDEEDMLCLKLMA
jgi:hypothetical protein